MVQKTERHENIENRTRPFLSPLLKNGGVCSIQRVEEEGHVLQADQNIGVKKIERNRHAVTPSSYRLYKKKKEAEPMRERQKIEFRMPGQIAQKSGENKPPARRVNAPAEPWIEG